MYEQSVQAHLDALAKRLAEGEMSLEEYDKAFNTFVRNFERLSQLSRTTQEDIK